MLFKVDYKNLAWKSILPIVRYTILNQYGTANYKLMDTDFSKLPPGFQDFLETHKFFKIRLAEIEKLNATK